MSYKEYNSEAENLSGSDCSECANPPAISLEISINPDTVIRHICENCGKVEELTSEEGYENGWDYPPRMGSFGIVSPRTCGSCGIDTTLWWQLEALKVPVNQLSPKHQETLTRILSEPVSIIVERDSPQ